MAFPIIKTKLSNGLNLLIKKYTATSNVSMQLWYGVGSKHESEKQRGYAHLVEHMIFKGTEKLKEGDIDGVAYKLSASCNAFTSYDYTGYTFDVPAANYEKILPVMADCMKGCTFKQNLLNSELKAVIQELKMYEDDTTDSLVKSLFSNIFCDHLYSHPIIGYKDTILSSTTQSLKDFYQTYYTPSNATLVIVGNIDEKECIEEVKKQFGALESHVAIPPYKSNHVQRLESSENTLYRDIQQPQIVFAWELPQSDEKTGYMYDVLASILASGRGSRLFKLLCDELCLAMDVESFVYDLFDHPVLFIHCQPASVDALAKIKELIHSEIKDIAKNDFSNDEYSRGIKRTKMSYAHVFEDTYKMASAMGRLFVQTGNENALYTYQSVKEDEVKRVISSLFKDYIISERMHCAQALPASEKGKFFLEKHNEQIDHQDKEALDKIVRSDEIELPEYMHTVKTENPKPIEFPEYQKHELKNGLTVYACHNEYSEKVDICIDFKAKHYFDDTENAGRLGILFDLMEEGSKKYKQWGPDLESHGMEFEAHPGSIVLSVLPEKLEQGFDFLQQYICEPLLQEDAFAKVKERTLIDIKEFWDDPASVARQLIRQHVYQDHPYGKNPGGTYESVSALDISHIKDAYTNFISPRDTVFLVSGNIKNIDIESLVHRYFSNWSGPEVESVLIDLPSQTNKANYTHVMCRDQLVLSYGSVSVKRFDERYDALLLFDQILGGGVTGSMRSKLFALREQTGMYYTIGGTLLAGAGKHPGMIYIRAMTSPSLLEKAQNQIMGMLQNVTEGVSQEDVDQARRAILFSLDDLYATNRSRATTMLFLHRYGLDRSFIRSRFDLLNAITKDQVIDSVNQVLDPHNMISLVVGRV